MASVTLYDRIGVSYDTTRRADTYLTSRIADLLELSDGRRFVDVACGTGNYTCALSDIAGQWYGVDVSMTMLSCTVLAFVVPSRSLHRNHGGG